MQEKRSDSSRDVSRAMCRSGFEPRHVTHMCTTMGEETDFASTLEPQEALGSVPGCLEARCFVTSNPAKSPSY